MLFSSFSTRSMVFAYFAKAQLPFSLFRDLFNDTAEFTLCYGLHDCSHLFQGYFIHSLSTLYYYNAPSLTTRLTGDYRDRTYTGKCSPALLDTRKKIRYRKFCDTSFFSVDFLLFLLIRSPANKSSQCAFFRLPCSRSYEQIFPMSFKFFHWRALRPSLLLLICKIISKM